MKAVCIEKPWSVGVKEVERVEPNYKVVSVDEAPETLRDIEKNPGNYLKVVVKF